MDNGKFSSMSDRELVDESLTKIEELNPDRRVFREIVARFTAQLNEPLMIPVMNGPHDGEWWPNDYDAIRRGYKTEVSARDGSRFFFYVDDPMARVSFTDVADRVSERLQRRP